MTKPERKNLLIKNRIPDKIPNVKEKIKLPLIDFQKSENLNFNNTLNLDRVIELIVLINS